MPVQCAKCGEVLLGAVNRCWRCGATISSRPGEPELPPVRATPAAPISSHAPSPPRGVGPSIGGPSISGAAAIVTLVLGVLSLASSFFTIGALVLAVAGLPVGVLGLFSSRRNPAILGMLLCCVALAISGFQAAAWLVHLRYGISPWQTPTGY